MEREVEFEFEEEVPVKKIRIKKEKIKLEPMKIFQATAEHLQRLKQQCLEKRKSLFTWEVPNAQ